MKWEVGKCDHLFINWSMFQNTEFFMPMDENRIMKMCTIWEVG
jgi:hypothetical protein